ncbi:MAG: bifunctional metallophosphatase/5'-nucleotidase [Prevotella sp.]|nr:bifunctional metallophosphatase/5'-nucleotidase [Prevotella sp.]
MRNYLSAAILAILIMIPMVATAKKKTVTIKVIETSDVHGCFFPYDFINRRPLKGSMARVMTYVRQQREQFGKNVILVDNGDILQGQPTCYYCNYVKPEIPNVAAEVINYMGFDAETLGNHDVETGHAVYDKWIREVKCPMLGANIIDTKTGKPYVHPYTLIEREGVRIAIIGMLTPAIPNWLNEGLWSGLRFEEMVMCARYWIDYVKANERPDIIIGLFHSGKDGGIVTPDYEEDASLRIAKEVPGFDIILYGHDHTQYKDVVKNTAGQDVVFLDPSCNALMVAEATIEVTKGKRGKIVGKRVTGDIINVSELPVDEAFVKHFQSSIDSVKSFVDRRIGEFENSIYTRDCYFGNAAFTDFIHDLQLKLTDADISFNAPLSFNTSIKAGPVYVSDMFNLYRYENMLYVVRMTGEEVRKHLEMSYDQWVNTMKSPDDHIMLLNDGSTDDKQRFMFKNLAFNFDSAVGIDYEVDVTKPDGQKVRILRMSNGEPFDEAKWYKVAMNSYRGNGGGELLTRGAGISLKELPNRIIFQSDRDQRYYLMQEIEKAGRMNPQTHNNWRFVPEEWAKPAIERDRKLLFGR